MISAKTRAGQVDFSEKDELPQAFAFDVLDEPLDAAIQVWRAISSAFVRVFFAIQCFPVVHDPLDIMVSLAKFLDTR